MSYLSDESIERLRRAGTPDLSGTRYRLIEWIGSGGMGAVYKVEDTVLGRMVALKIAHDTGTVEEARVIAALEHPGIVPVHDAGSLADGSAFYAMKLVEGEPLSEYRGPFTDRLRLYQKICEAVAFAHSRGVVHGDLKPSNIMTGSFGEALVMDWGIAVAGTVGYMAPEQDRTPQYDLYALGVILRGLISDTRTRRAMASIVAKATAESPRERYASALELRDEVARYLAGERVAAHRESVGERAARLFARHRVAILLVATYLVMRVVLLLVLQR